MHSINQFIEQGYNVFSLYERPVQCINHQNDLEYLEYEQALKGIDVKSLTMKHIGSQSWGPLFVLNPEAFSHFLPKIIEFAVNDSLDNAREPFIIYFVLVIGVLPEHERFELLGSEQLEFIYRTLLLLKGLYFEKFIKLGYEQELNLATDAWKT